MTSPVDPLAGDWNGFIFKRTAPDQLDEIQDLLYNNFFPDEPLTKNVGFLPDKSKTPSWKDLLGGPLSFGVYENSTDKLVAIRLTEIAKPNDPHPQPRSEPIRKIVKIFNILEKEADVFNKFNVSEYVSFVLTTVHKDFRGRGIATEIYRRSISLCQHLGHQLIVCNFSSPFSLKAALNLGFEEVAVCNYFEMKDDKGRKFIEASQPRDEVVLAVYKLWIS